jgi:hypothetical protein
MNISELVIYLFFILFFLLGQYLKRRRMAFRQAEIALAVARSENAESSLSASSAVGTLRAKSAYRSLEGTQAAPETFKLLKAGVQKSAYRKQFKSHPGLQQAVVSMVVLGACRADAPYENVH